MLNAHPLLGGIDIDAGYYDWSVSSTLGSQAVYGITIAYEFDPTVSQFSDPFLIRAVGGDATTIINIPFTTPIPPTSGLNTQTGSIYSSALVSEVSGVPRTKQSDQSPQLSSRAIAGIAVGGAVLLILILSLAWLALYYRKKARGKSETCQKAKPEADENQIKRPHSVGYFQNNRPIYELSKGRPQEIDSRTVQQELSSFKF
jgi:hypothetical protein